MALKMTIYASKNVGILGHSYTAGSGTLNNNGPSLLKVNMQLPHNPDIVVLGVLSHRNENMFTQTPVNEYI